jgi:hypothetical protein
MRKDRQGDALGLSLCVLAESCEIPSQKPAVVAAEFVFQPAGKQFAHGSSSSFAIANIRRADAEPTRNFLLRGSFVSEFIQKTAEARLHYLGLQHLQT